jgi:hypothetical protein
MLALRPAFKGTNRIKDFLVRFEAANLIDLREPERLK